MEVDLLLFVRLANSSHLSCLLLLPSTLKEVRFSVRETKKKVSSRASIHTIPPPPPPPPPPLPLQVRPRKKEEEEKKFFLGLFWTFAGGIVQCSVLLVQQEAPKKMENNGRAASLSKKKREIYQKFDTQT